LDGSCPPRSTGASVRRTRVDDGIDRGLEVPLVAVFGRVDHGTVVGDAFVAELLDLVAGFSECSFQVDLGALLVVRLLLVGVVGLFGRQCTEGA
jgi:hypothetical protein